MANINTSRDQDITIEDAKRSPHIENLCAIIDELDNQLSEWRHAAAKWDCDSPEQLVSKIDSLPETY